MTIDGESPAAAMAGWFRVLMAFVTGFFFVTHRAILTVPGSANTVAASAPSQVMAIGCGSAVAFFTGGFLVVANQAEFQIPARLATMHLFP